MSLETLSDAAANLRIRVEVKLVVDGVELERGFDLAPWDATLLRVIGHKGGLSGRSDAYLDAFSNEAVGVLERWIKEEARRDSEEWMSGE